MAWIESHAALEGHPKLVDLMGATGWDLDTAIGKLHRFWWWCQKYAEDGDLRRHGPARIAGAMGCPPSKGKSLLKALTASGWVDKKPYLRVHDWWRYAGPWLRGKYKRNPSVWEEIRGRFVKEPVPGEQRKSGITNLGQWSAAIKARDGRCLLCGIRKNLHAHHIYRVTDDVSKCYDLENGATLCKKCHEKVTGNEEQFVEKLKKLVHGTSHGTKHDLAGTAHQHRTEPNRPTEQNLQNQPPQNGQSTYPQGGKLGGQLKSGKHPLNPLATRMPFGEFKGVEVQDLEPSYCEWLIKKFPGRGRLGAQIIKALHMRVEQDKMDKDLKK